ncbi:hypothetical protein BpHYR1_019440 [Brachionus plicatilis]|uniref:Uncharacterized protein n=1 Tax=Brachionus plicatilis TaxID=10195 RepID=A0A3M7REJ2_BRAPC|nr:hypothetical protein BpHYR1_019440 [Brachionus plicatilis]
MILDKCLNYSSINFGEPRAAQNGTKSFFLAQRVNEIKLYINCILNIRVGQKSNFKARILKKCCKY